MAQAETEAYNVKNVQSLRTKQLNVMKEEKEGNGDGDGEGEGNLALNSWHVRAATPTQGPRGKQFGKPTRTSHSLAHTHGHRHTHMCRLQPAPGLGAINVTGPAISLKCLAYVCYLMLIFILFPLELLMLAVVSISPPSTQGYLARRLDKPGRQLNANN